MASRNDLPDAPVDPAADPDRAARQLLDRPRADLIWHHDLGSCLERLEGEGVAPLADRLDISTARVYQHLWFARTYTREQAAALDERRVPWSYLVAVMGFERATDRDRLLRQASEQGWSLPRLRAEIRSVQPSKRPGAGRKRQPRASQGVAADLARLEAVTREWVETYHATWPTWGRPGAGAADRLRQPSAAQPAGELAARLRNLAASLGEASDAAHRLAERLRLLAEQAEAARGADG